MKTIFYVFAFIIFLITGTFAQKINNQIEKVVKDSANTIKTTNFSSDMKFYGDFYESNKLSFDRSIWTKTLGSLNDVNNSNFISPSVTKNMLAPLRLQYIDSQKFSIFSKILGAAQMTAVGYMAYQHIKKFGFIRKAGK